MFRLKTKQKLLIGSVAGALLASSCGGSATTSATPTIDTSGTIASSSDVEPTTSTTTTTTTTTTTVETSAVESELANMERPELEVSTEWDSELDEIYGRYLMYWEALYNAIGPPFADPSYEPLLELLDPGVVEDVQGDIQEYFDAEAVGLRPEGSLDDHGLRLPNPSLLSKTEGNRVVIQDCWIRDETVKGLDGEIVTEYFSTLLWNVDMITIEGEWKVFGITEAGPDSDGYQECQDLFDTLER